MSNLVSENTLPQWRIELCERPVFKGATMDRLLYGKNLSHPFLALLDQNDVVKGEIHGVPYDHTRGFRQGKLNKLFEFSTIYTTPLFFDKPFQALIEHSPFKQHYPTLRSLFFEKARQYDRAAERVVLVESDGETINTLWQDLEASAKRLDALDLPYNRHGARNGSYNCQATIATILKENDLEDILPSGQLATPGWKIIPQPLPS